jgi:hypothetical protein
MEQPDHSTDDQACQRERTTALIYAGADVMRGGKSDADIGNEAA